MEQVDWLSSREMPSVHVHSGRTEPVFWISRLLLLNAPRLEKDAIIRDIPLRRGLNILWAKPSAVLPASPTPPSKVTGHSAGKTTFCRIIRYLLGESRFGVPALQEQIRTKLPDGWIVAEVFVHGQPWIVSRSFARWEHRFAVKGSNIEVLRLWRRTRRLCCKKFLANRFGSFGWLRGEDLSSRPILPSRLAKI